MKKLIKYLAITIISISAITGAFFTHLVILNLKSYNTLGVEASGEPEWMPVFVSAAVLAIGVWLYNQKIGSNKGQMHISSSD